MATSVNAHAGAWLDGVAVAGQDLRLQLAAAMLTGASPSGTTGIAARPGVRYGTGSPLLVQASSGMNITVNAGTAFVQGSVAATAGMYTCCLDTTATLTVATSDPTNPRIDNVICQVTDNGNNTSTTVVALQTGTPAPSPVAPTLPANSLLLATIAVGAGVSSINSGNITDGRVFTAANGGILPMANTTGGISGPAGTYADDLSTGRLRRADGSGNARAPKVGAFAAAYNQVTGSIATNTSAYLSVASVTATCDGVTEVEVFAQWLSVSPASGTVAGDYVGFVLAVDGSAAAMAFGASQATITRVDSTSLNNADGGNLRNWVTPSAGTHTFALMALSAGHAFSVNYPFIRVAPSLQQ